MLYKLFLVFLLCTASFISKGQDVNFMPKPLNKDLKKLWEKDLVELKEIEIPDSMYNDILMDKG